MNKIFYVTHAKGGSGTSLFSTNFAYALSQQLPNKRILFLDANQLSDIAHFFGITAKKNIINLEMLLEEQSPENLNQENVKSIFDKVVYGIDKLDVLLSPEDYHSLDNLAPIYKMVLKQALKVYDYIIIDTGKNNHFLLQNSLPMLHSLLTVTNVDNPSITKTTNFLASLEAESLKNKIKIVCNQTGTFSQKDLDAIFKYPIVCSLPTEINGAWDNILLGVPILKNDKLAYSKKINEAIPPLINISL